MAQGAAHESETTDPSSVNKRFKLLAQLGAGGMALVHLAVAKGAAGAEKLVVLKSIRPDLIEDKKVVSMFADEARLAVQLSHPNVVQTYDVVTFGALPIIVMEYLEGQSLLKCVNATMPMNLRLHVLREALAGLDYAHAVKSLDGTPLGIVHRDMSPQNVIITYDGHVKVLDFGIAKAMGQSAHTETGEMKGKLRYMAPEQMIGRGVIDRRADLFSVGVMLWEALTQSKIWANLSDVEVIQTVLESGIAKPSTAAEGVPEALEAVCMKAAAEHPDNRYSTAFDMLEDLNQAIAAASLQATTRDLANWMEATFSDRRARMRALVRSQLEQEHAKLIEIGTDTHEQLSGLNFSSLRTSSSPAPFRSPQKQRKVRALWVAGTATLLVAVAGFLVSLLRHNSHSAAAAASSASAVVLQPANPVDSASGTSRADKDPPPVATQVEVHLAAVPQSARIFLDDAEISNPYTARRAVDGASHTLRVEARGYQSKALQLGSFQGPVDYTVTLEQASKGRAGGPGPVTKPHAEPAATPTATPTPKSGECDSPFYRDSSGIMHVKPECVH